VLVTGGWDPVARRLASQSERDDENFPEPIRFVPIKGDLRSAPDGKLQVGEVAFAADSMRSSAATAASLRSSLMRLDPAPVRAVLSCVVLFLGVCACDAGGLGRESSVWSEEQILTDADFRDVFFLDNERGWMVGGGHQVDGGIIAETRDGGATWRVRTGIVPDPRSRLFSLNAVHFHDASTGVIVSTGGRILRTVDAGEHWHTLVRAGRQLSSLFFLDAQTGWAAGEQWVMRTEDGGATWHRANSTHDGNDDFRARDLHFVDAYRGWLVGHHGAIRRTRDGGASWERVEVALPDPTMVLQAIQFLDPSSGWIVGDGGTILRTQDAGATWNLQETRTGLSFRDLHFADAQRGWLVGYDVATGVSSVLHTEDGGVHWEAEARIEGESLKALFFHPDGRGWAVGDRVRRQPQRLLRYAPPSP
jgi:photosystem II stability/assembly factor-like uncharacterized protein